MSTKYSVSATTRWRTENDYPRLTTHAQQRWDERSPHWSRSPEYAYEKSISLVTIQGYFERHEGDLDDVRYYAEYHEEYDEEYGAIFLVRNDGIVTIYLERFVSSNPVQAYLSELKTHTISDTHGIDE